MSSSIEKAIDRLDQQKISTTPNQGSDQNAEITGSDSVDPTVPKRNTPLCTIDMANLEKHGFLTPDMESTSLAEEYRLIKRPLLMNAMGKGAAPVENGNLIMVSSALPGEGKTFTSVNLAMSMAMELDVTVLLIDSDVVKPALTNLFGLESRPGLIDLLLDDHLDIGDVIVNTSLKKLRVIPAGRSHVYSTELLASDQMRRITQELSQRYSDRIVLFDCPPLLATSQATVLSHLIGQVLMVVEAGKTSESVVTDAISLLDTNKVIGMVLNKSRGAFRGDYYGGYYGSHG
jgi:protein-tyrosine kinase